MLGNEGSSDSGDVHQNERTKEIRKNGANYTEVEAKVLAPVRVPGLGWKIRVLRECKLVCCALLLRREEEAQGRQRTSALF